MESLAADIRENGLHERIVLYQGLILEGKNRYAACLKAGVTPQYDPFKFENDDAKALAFVISKNVPRRHLTDSQRAMVAARLCTLTHGGDRRSDKSAKLRLEAISQDRAAERLHVSRRSVQSATKVLNSEIERLIDGVTHSALPVHVAAKACDLFPREQIEELLGDFTGGDLRKAVQDAQRQFESGQKILSFKVDTRSANEFEEAATWMGPDRLFLACFEAYKEKELARHRRPAMSPQIAFRVSPTQLRFAFRVQEHRRPQHAQMSLPF